MMAIERQNPPSPLLGMAESKFDPVNDNIEDFCKNVKNLANQLGYPEDAQVMAM